MSAIEVHHVTKEYRLGSLIGLKDAVLNRVKRLRGLPALERQPFKALDDVDFQVEAGEVVGIIGHNGAGKSTLLKILSGIVTPTRGSVRVVGRIAPLIEVGAGLVGDLTGRENIFLNGAILGMKRTEISKIFDEIVAFSELAEFIDTPVKRYSSGMKVKLAFSVASHVLADVLIIDEVLAVGDLAFQRKCFSRMEDIIERRGLTVLLVSHNIRQVERLCGRTLLLQQGHIVEDGNTSRVCDIYYSNMNRVVLANAQKTRLAGLRVKSSGETEILDAQVLDKDGAPVDAVVSGEPLVIRIRFRLLAPLERPEFHIGTHTTDFIYVTGSSSAVLESRPDLGEGVHEISQTIDSFQVKPGTYCVRFAVLDKHRRVVYHGETLHIFGVLPKVSEALQDELRMVDIPVTWMIDGQQLASASSHAADPEAAINGVAAGYR